MKYISIIDKENEWFFDSEKIEWKEGLKTKTQSNVSSFIINDEIVVTSSMNIKYTCETCDAEIISKFSNFKNRKSNECISCIRKRTVGSFHKNIDKNKRSEINKKISKKTKEAMSQFSNEKKNEINRKKVESINWEQRNKKWIETMSLKSVEEKNEMYEKISKSMKKRYEEYGPWNLKYKNPNTKYSTIDCKYYKRGKHSSNEKITIVCDNCGEEFETIRMAAARQEREHPGYIQCINCVNSAKSYKEKELVEWLKSFGLEITENTKKIITPQELDIYIPSNNLAIEFNGLYWHSEQTGTTNDYHLQKTLQCEEKGIQLIHIFQDDWLYKQEIVKARLKNLLGLNLNRIGARKTLIKEIDPKTKNEFLEKYHIQGRDNSSVKLGAFYEDELVGVMTFSKNRNFNRKKSKSNHWELSRFATISDTYTPGLASKMLRYFENNYNWEEIHSYADRKWSQGKLYYMLGFDYDSTTPPSYWYSKDGSSERQHRYNFRKQNLINFENYSVDKTEKQIMDEAGYLRIYDCGNYKFIKKTPSNEGAKLK